MCPVWKVESSAQLYFALCFVRQYGDAHRPKTVKTKEDIMYEHWEKRRMEEEKTEAE